MNNQKTKKSNNTKTKTILKKSVSKKRLQHPKTKHTDSVPTKDTNNPNEGEYKKELLEVNELEKNYDKLFQEKLSSEYTKFRNAKDHEIQIKKFLRAFSIILVIILLAMLLLTFG